MLDFSNLQTRTWLECGIHIYTFNAFCWRRAAYSYKYFLWLSQKVPEATGLSHQIWDSSGLRTIIYLYTFTVWNALGEHWEALWVLWLGVTFQFQELRNIDPFKVYLMLKMELGNKKREKQALLEVFHLQADSRFSQTKLCKQEYCHGLKVKCLSLVTLSVLNTWFPAGGAALEGCSTLGMWCLADGHRPLGAGTYRLHLPPLPI